MLKGFKSLFRRLGHAKKDIGIAEDDRRDHHLVDGFCGVWTDVLYHTRDSSLILDEILLMPSLDVHGNFHPISHLNIHSFETQYAFVRSL